MADKVAAVVHADKDTNATQRVSAFGAAIIGSRIPILDSRLTDNAITVGRFTLNVTGTGSGVIATRALTLATGATAGSTAIFQSAVPLRQVINFENEVVPLLMLTNPMQADNTIRWGIFNATDGLFYEVRNAALRLVRRKASVDNIITVFNGTNPILDANRHIYQLRYLLTAARFFQDGNLIHSLTGTTAGTLFAKEEVPFRLEVANGVTAGDTGLILDGFIAQRWGGTVELGPGAVSEARIGTSVTSVLLTEENMLRSSVCIHNDSNHALKVKFAPGPASQTSYTHVIKPGDMLVVSNAHWIGKIFGILDAGIGFAQVSIITEA